MSTKTLAKSRVALTILTLLSLLFLIQTGENKMAIWNPATWTVVDNLQGQNDPISGFVDGSAGTAGDAGNYVAPAGGGGGWGDSTGVLGATSYNGTLYYDPTTGQIGGTNMDGTPIGTGTQAGQNNPNQLTPQQISQQNAARNSFNVGRQSIFDSLNARGAAEAGNRQLSAQTALDAFRQSQQGIDQQRINATMGKQQASQGILDMINQGMRNTNVRLSNKNASNSSAQNAAARAYAAMGAKQQTAANNQYELQNRNIDVSQGNLATSINQERAKRELEKTNLVNGLVDQARQSFITLNDAAAGASIGDRIAIETEKENIRQKLLAQLQDAENYFNTGTQGIQAMGGEAVAGEASKLRAAGQVSPDAFMAQAPDVSQSTQGGSPIFNVIANRRRMTA